jgi:hypothetical protein
LTKSQTPRIIFLAAEDVFDDLIAGRRSFSVVPVFCFCLHEKQAKFKQRGKKEEKTIKEDVIGFRPS